ncbi:uncharacterized protein VTP21DRAFT_10389 [Calcarisporiella thermophila]|uniref:uncharacterized protein n=1 Tax=Calcarisporiella thermophila TaxID=911321 RepID=UPI00374412A5
MTSYINKYTEVTRGNFASLFPLIKDILSRASFVALDTEFTGLGGSGFDTRAGNIEDRYKSLRKVALTHALVALGITTFEHGSENGRDQTNYIVHNFNFLLLREDDHQVSSKSLSFLAESGFDFNRQYREGIMYTPGEDKLSSFGSTNNLMRALFGHLLKLRIPVAIHNGLLDLIYLYHSFHAELPTELNIFIADLNDMFPAGIYDTKYVADYVTRERASFLAYLFRKYERVHVRDESKEGGQSKTLHLEVCERLTAPPVEIKSQSAVEASSLDGKKRKKRNPPDNNKPYCVQYAYHGFCSQGFQCGKSHDLDLILNEEEKERAHKKRSKQSPSNHEPILLGEQAKSLPIESVVSPCPSLSPTTLPMPSFVSTATSSSYHSAHMDSYMTGFVFAHQLLTYNEDTILHDHRNLLYLIGKSFPLRVAKSAFAKTSKGHEDRMKRIDALWHEDNMH